MSDQALTPNEFIRLDKGEIEDLFEQALPQSKGKSYFDPSLYNPVTNTTLVEMKKWKAESTAKAAERKAILNWIIPLVLIGPGLVSMILAGGWSKPTSIILTGCAVAVITYLWFFGRIWAWERKRFERNVGYAESAFKKVQKTRAMEWAEERYDINTDYVEWSESSNFYITGKAYQWKELPVDGHYVIVEVETVEEPPLLASAK